MKLTKYGHACVFVEKNGSHVVIDPGSLTELPEDLSNVIAVICTHVHGDHTDAKNVQKIVEQSPDVVVFALPEALAMLTEVSREKVAISDDAELTVGPFALKMQVVDHAVIWQKSPCKNLTVMIDDFYYYPGDSLEIADTHIEVVGVPFSAPWLKIAEAIEFVRKMDADYVMPTHNGLFNEKGREFNDYWLKVGLEDTNKSVLQLLSGEIFDSSINKSN